MSHSSPIRILHVEVGGSYGGSLRGLEIYLAHSDSRRFEHDLLLYYPTPETDTLLPFVRRLLTLYDRAPAVTPLGSTHSLMRKLRRSFPPGATRAYLNLRSWNRLLANAWTIRRLLRVISSGGYDLIHVNNTFTYQASTLLAARLAGKPTIAHVQNPIERSQFSRAMMRLADCIVTINRSLQRELQAWGLPVEIQACYQCVELPPPDKSRAAAFRASLVQPGGVLIGSVGRLDAQKGFEDFIVAARRVADVHADAHFAIVGEGPLRASLEMLIRDLRLADRFTLCGFRSDVADFLSAIDYFVCSSLWEGGPLVVVEAMLLGKPVVATSVGLIPEIMPPGQIASLVPPANPTSLAEAILRALDSTQDRTHQVHAARESAMALTAPHENARHFDDLIQRVVRHAHAK